VDARPIRSSPETQIAGEIAPHHRAILFDLHKRKIRYVIAGHTRPVHALAISDDARRLASGDSGGILKLWDTETGSELLSMEGHLNGVRAIAFHPQGRQFASIGGDAAVRMWRGE
jgi:WD40 repeat protein